MNKDEKNRKRFLEEQVRWCKEQDRIFEQIELKLYEMKQIVEYALEHELPSTEINELNGQLSKLKSQVSFLENQLQSIVH